MIVIVVFNGLGVRSAVLEWRWTDVGSSESINHSDNVGDKWWCQQLFYKDYNPSITIYLSGIKIFDNIESVCHQLYLLVKNLQEIAYRCFQVSKNQNKRKISCNPSPTKVSQLSNSTSNSVFSPPRLITNKVVCGERVVAFCVERRVAKIVQQVTWTTV